MNNTDSLTNTHFMEHGAWKGIGFQLFQDMKKYSNNIFQHMMENNVDETYNFILGKSIRVAINLREKKLGDDPIIAICAENHSNSCITLIAALFLNYRLVTYDATLSEKDLSYLLNQVTPNLMILDENVVSCMENSLKQIGKQIPLIVFEQCGKYETFDSLLEVNDEKEKCFEPMPVDSDERTSLILFSSGTTGLQKGICLSHAGILENSRLLGTLQDYSEDSKILSFTTFNWVTGPVLLIACAMFGAARVIAPISRAIEAIHKYKVSHSYTSTYKASLLLNQEDEGISLDSLRSLMTLGTKMGYSLFGKLRKKFPNTLINQSYGQTEACGWISTFPITSDEACSLAQRKPESIGKLLPNIEFKIVDPESEKPLGEKEVGELRIKGKLMNGYFNKDSSIAFDSDGYLKTGDLMYYDEDKCFFIVGRCKELLKYRGFHIQPHMLEMILESRPEVEKAVVVGIPHEIDGDHPMALVVLRADFDGPMVTAEELELYVEERVQGRQKLRAGVKFVDHLPYTSTGKPKRYLIKELLQSNQL